MILPIEIFTDYSFGGEVVHFTKEFDFDSYLIARPTKKTSLKHFSKDYFKKHSLADFDKALKVTSEQLASHRDSFDEDKDYDSFMIFSGHLLMLADKAMVGEMRKKISNGVNPPSAIVEVILKHLKLFQKSKSKTFQEKALDFKDIGSRLLANLLMKNHVVSLKGKVVVVDQIFPSQFLKFFFQGARGVLVISDGSLTESGAISFHTKILSKSLKMGLAYLDKRAFWQCNLKTKKMLYKEPVFKNLWVDGGRSKLEVNLRKASLLEKITQFEKKLNFIPKKNTTSISKADSKVKTRDGVVVNILGNVSLLEGAEELATINQYQTSIGGVGLFRTEMFFMLQRDFPSEEVQYRYYRKLIEVMPEKEYAIRTLDLGDDKKLPYFITSDKIKQNSQLVVKDLGKKTLKENLNLRGIRFSLKYPKIFSEQLRALIHLSVDYPVKIILPFITSVKEVLLVKKILKDCETKVKKKLLSSNSFTGFQYKLGVMVEIPSTLFILDELAKEVDFFSLGTNDLIAYLFARDKNQSQLKDLPKDYSITMLRCVAKVIKAAKLGEVGGESNQIEITQCGDIDPTSKYVEYMLGLGMRNFSIPISKINMFAKKVRRIDVAKAQKEVARHLNN